jgi:hypothetical protein
MQSAAARLINGTSLRIRLGICLLIAVVATQGIASIVLAGGDHRPLACAAPAPASLVYGGLPCDAH